MSEAMRKLAPTGRQTRIRPAAGILTPDRRLRVFVSSSLHELADERSAVRSAIESLRLTPILFELGARPHPPSSLYRAYLAQSEVFIGIYWRSGGWVAPGSGVSGIEDEYNLGRRLPRLMYVKEPAPGREARLVAMLDRIRSDADVSYREFASPEELRALVADDLAVLVSEHFQGIVRPRASTMPRLRRSPGNLPHPVTPLIDRAGELALLKTLLADERVRLITLTGPGGVGKTRLAIEAARAASTRFRGGGWLVPLALVREPDQVPVAILDALGLPAAGARPATEALADHLRSSRHLLVLDNFEQALAAAALVAEMLAAVPRLKVLVTTRATLRLRAEHDVPLSPLAVPSERDSAAEEFAAPAVQLFIDRARAARPDFRADPASASALAEITRRLDGLPLAIELAAAHSRLLPPVELLERLNDSLDLGSAGLRDLPDRQRTLRNAMRWSFDLLGDRERDVFMRLAVFRGGFTLEAADAVCGTRDGMNMIEVIGSLVDSSLVQPGNNGKESRYAMLEVVRQYALERLDESGLEAEARAHHARFFTELVAALSAGVFGSGQRRCLNALDREYDNIAAAMDWHLDSGDVERLAEMTWGIWPYWCFFGRLDGGGRRTRAALAAIGRSELATARLAGTAGLLALWLGDVESATSLLETALPLFRRMSDINAAATVLTLKAVATWAVDPEGATALIAESRPMFTEVGNRWGVALCANVRSWLAPELDDTGNATPYAREALALAEESGDDLNLGMALGNLGAQELELGELQPARDHIGRSLRLLAGLRAQYAITHIFGLAARVALLGGDAATGVELMGSAEAIRAWLQLPVHPAQVERRERIVAALRERSDPHEFDRLWSLGKALDFDSAVSLAIGACGSA